MQLLFSSLPFRGSLERNVGKEREREREGESRYARSSIVFLTTHVCIGHLHGCYNVVGGPYLSQHVYVC